MKHVIGVNLEILSWKVDLMLVCKYLKGPLLIYFALTFFKIKAQISILSKPRICGVTVGHPLALDSILGSNRVL